MRHWMTTRAYVGTFLITLLAAAGCRPAPPRQPRWEVGYWYWLHAARAAGPIRSTVSPDVLYVQVGLLSPSGLGKSRWPTAAPRARSYVATWRSDEPKVPDPSLVEALANAYRRVELEALRAGQQVVGLQLDVDCPTGSLYAYGDFLRRLHRAVGSERRVSITALLDWFREGTQVRRVVAAVDEYVPQFYDAGPSGPGAQIAETIAAEKWAARFNDLGIPYRIGIAVFGRIQRVRDRTGGTPVREAFRDVSLLDLWSRHLGTPQVEANGSGERVLRWRVARQVPPALEAGDGVEAIISTPASVRAAYAAARAFGGLCAGVVFFRWPDSNETLAMSPDEIAETLAGATTEVPPELRASDGSCLERACTDLSVRLHDRFPTRAIELRLEASSDVQYLMPAYGAVTMKQVGARRIVVSIPPFVGEREILLGRAFSRQPGR